MNALSDLPNGDTDALDLHNFKQSLYNLSDYGTQGEGLSGRADGIVKQIAHFAMVSLMIISQSIRGQHGLRNNKESIG